MKKTISIIAAAALTLALCACDKADYTSENSTNSISDHSAPTSSGNDVGSSEHATPADGDNVQTVPSKNALTLLCNGDGIMRTGCGTEDGYYCLESNVSYNQYPHITYIDYASVQEVILCSDSSCKHDTERCSSVISSWAVIYMFFYKEHLYYFTADYDQEGVMSSGGSFNTVDNSYGYETAPHEVQSELYRMNPDGTNRELIYTFGEKETLEGLAIGDGDSIWFITKELTLEHDEKTGATLTGSKNRALVQLDLNKRMIVEQLPISYSDNIRKDFIGVCGRKFIFAGTAYPDGKSQMDYIDIVAPSPIVGDMSGMNDYLAFMSKCEYAFFTLDVSDRTLKEIYRSAFNEISRNYTQIGDKLYIPTGDNYMSAMSLDLNTGNTENFPVPDGYMLDGFIGERPLFITTDGKYTRFFADPDTGELTRCIFETGSYNIIAINGDTALVIYKTVGEELPDGGVRNPHDLYALISLDDLYNGRENFKPITMLEGSK